MAGPSPSHINVESLVSPLLLIAIGAPLAALWPLLLPLAFVRGSPARLRTYVVLVVTAFGVLGLAQLPNSLAFLFAFYRALDTDPGITRSGFAVSHGVAVAASLWALPKVRRALDRVGHAL